MVSAMVSAMVSGQSDYRFNGLQAQTAFGETIVTISYIRIY